MPQNHKASIGIGRVYEPRGGRAHRVLVDRLWPRGIRREAAPWDEWDRAVAPSAELRQWYGHDPARCEEFARRYRAELARPPAAEAAVRLRALAAEQPLVLLTATRDLERSGARVLRDYLLAQESGG